MFLRSSIFCQSVLSAVSELRKRTATAVFTMRLVCRSDRDMERAREIETSSSLPRAYACTRLAPVSFSQVVCSASFCLSERRSRHDDVHGIATLERALERHGGGAALWGALSATEC